MTKKKRKQLFLGISGGLGGGGWGLAGAAFIDGYILFSFLFFFLTSFSGGELKEMVSNSMGCYLKTKIWPFMRMLPMTTNNKY